VSKDCRDEICTYAIDIEAIMYNSKLAHCLQYFEDYIICGAGRAAQRPGGRGGAWLVISFLVGE